MNHEQHFLSIIDFLLPYENIWQYEILLIHENLEDFYPKVWLDELELITDPQIILDLEQKNYHQHLKNPELRNFYEKSLQLTTFEQYQNSKTLPENHYTFLYTIPKKQHEIRHLAPLINERMLNSNSKRVVDIGGGVGLLAQTVSNTYRHKVTSLDLDPVMQERAKKRNKKNTPDRDHLVEYRTIKIQNEDDLSEVFQKDDLTVGLHTCGPLANYQIKASVKQNVKEMISLGCCYLKLKNDETDQRISEFAKAHQPFIMTIFALTLASRAHKKFSMDDVILKTKVKHFRYTFHFLLELMGINAKEIILGNSNLLLYEKEFSEYAKHHFKNQKIENNMSDSELNNFYQRPENLKYIQRLLAAGLIRDTLSKSLETLLLLDRCLYLNENHYQAKLVSLFDETISPRHLAVLAQK
jgi:SAM-dependent methyltransferase